MKKILVLDTGKEWGGGTNSLLELLRRSDKGRYRFYVLFYVNYKRGKASDIKTEIEKLGIQFLLLKQEKPTVAEKIIKEIFRSLFFFSKKLNRHLIFYVDYHNRIRKNAGRIADILKEHKIDLLYMNNQPSSNLEGIIAAKMTHIRAVQHSRIEARLNSLEVKIANQGLSRIICVSEGVKGNLLQQGIESSRCEVVYNGIDPETKPGISSQEIRASYDISDDDIVIGTVGALIKRKRIADLIETLHKAASKTHCRLKCLIVGEGPEKDNLLKMVGRKDLNGRVIFTGFQSDAISHINAMDIFIMTSEKEGLPRVILEAMLMAKPVVASHITGISELIADGDSGMLVPPGNTGKFAGSIIELIENPELRKTMGANARKQVIEKFSMTKYISGVETVFAETLGI